MLPYHPHTFMHQQAITILAASAIVAMGVGAACAAPAKTLGPNPQ